MVKSYEVEGERVRYYSLERSEWEEVPLSMVDFAVTRRVNKEKKQRQQQILQQAEKTENNTYPLPVNTGYRIAPNVRLPSQEGLYAYTGMRVITMIQSQAELTKDKRRMALTLALPAPLLKKRTLVVLPGREAGVRILNPDPSFYAFFTDGAGANLELLRVKPRKNDRIVEGIESGLAGKPSESRSALPVKRTLLAPGLYKIESAKPLAPGEYAFGEVDQNRLNLDVWDFGIDSPGAKKSGQ
ncbi:MAG: hypothetical protein ACRD2B_07985 [Terriglobia bacterium]